MKKRYSFLEKAVAIIAILFDEDFPTTPTLTGGRFMYILKADTPNASYRINPPTVTDSEGNTVSADNLNFIVTSDNPRAIQISPFDNLTGEIIIGGPQGDGQAAIANVTATVWYGETLLGSFGEQFTVVAGDPSKVVGGGISFQGINPKNANAQPPIVLDPGATPDGTPADIWNSGASVPPAVLPTEDPIDGSGFGSATLNDIPTPETSNDPDFLPGDGESSSSNETESSSDISSSPREGNETSSGPFTDNPPPSTPDRSESSSGVSEEGLGNGGEFGGSGSSGSFDSPSPTGAADSSNSSNEGSGSGSSFDGGNSGDSDGGSSSSGNE
jgi:hypothetical protein